MELWEFWLLLMVTVNTIQNLIVFFVGRKFKKRKIRYWRGIMSDKKGLNT